MALIRTLTEVGDSKLGIGWDVERSSDDFSEAFGGRVGSPSFLTSRASIYFQ